MDSNAVFQTFPAEMSMLKLILESMTQGVAVADRQGRILFVNRVCESIFGQDIAGIGFDEWAEACGCYQSDLVTLYRSRDLPLARAIEGETVDETEIFVRNPQHPEGIWISVKGNPLWDEDGQLLGGVVFFHDITSRKERDHEIQRLTNAVEQTADSIFITNRSGMVEYVNPAFEQTTGYSRWEILGNSPSVLKSGIHDDEFYQKLWRTITSGQVFRGTITNRKKNGDIYYSEQTITPIRDSSGSISHYVSVLKDVTELRKIQEQEFQMRMARSVQQKFYNMPPPEIKGFDIAGAAIPADATGGDYFDFIPMPEGNLGICVGDVSGHGFASALLMAELRALLRAFARSETSLKRIFSSVNHALIDDLESNRFITLAFLCLRPAAHSFVYINAGHLPGYLLDSDGCVKQVLESTSIPLGMLAEHSFHSSRLTKLEPGEILVLLTDGITEAVDVTQKEFGADSALEYIREHRKEGAKQIVQGLCQVVRDFSGKSFQNDDITAVVCKCVDFPSLSE
jgi:PAS domain S-box-containing protein